MPWIGPHPRKDDGPSFAFSGDFEDGPEEEELEECAFCGRECSPDDLNPYYTGIGHDPFMRCDWCAESWNERDRDE